MSEQLVLPFAAIGAHHLPPVGGKGPNLGQLRRAGLPVPDGFCVTTRAFRHAFEGDAEMAALLDRLDRVPAGEIAAARAAGEALRAHIRARPMPPAIRDAALRAWERLGAEHAYA